MTVPAISVILPVYNGGEYIAPAIESVLNQDFTNFEFIIVNDGSTDNTASIIDKYANKDLRIRVISRENRGLVCSLNEAIQLSRGDLIARMDADDICMPSRLGIQMQYMLSNDLDVCGSNIGVFGKKFSFHRAYPEHHNDIVFSFLFESPLAHPVVMIRAAILKDNLYTDCVAEDYELWLRLAEKGYKFGNLQQVLLRYRKHESQLTARKLSDIREYCSELSNKFAKNYYLRNSIDHEIFWLQKYSKIELRQVIDLYLLAYETNKVSISVVSDAVFDCFRRTNELDTSCFYETVRCLKKKSVHLSRKRLFLMFLMSLFGLNKDSMVYEKMKKFIFS